MTIDVSEHVSGLSRVCWAHLGSQHVGVLGRNNVEFLASLCYTAGPCFNTPSPKCSSFVLPTLALIVVLSWLCNANVLVNYLVLKRL